MEDAYVLKAEDLFELSRERIRGVAIVIFITKLFEYYYRNLPSPAYFMYVS
jgi:hypothetical protein